MADKEIFYDTSVTGNSTIIKDTNWKFQSFTTTGGFTISEIHLYLKKFTSPGTVTVSIKEVDGNSEPKLSDLASGTIDGNTFQGSFTWETIIMDVPYALDAATEYAIVVRALDGDALNFITWGVNTSGGYAGGQFGTSANSGGVWDNTYNAWDAGFETYSEVVDTETLEGTIAGTSVVSGGLAVAIALTGAIAGTSVVGGGLTGIDNITGTIAGVSVVSGAITFANILVKANIRTIRRVVAVGNNQLWYEDI